MDDTSPEVKEYYYQRLREMSIAEKAHRWSELYKTGIMLVRADVLKSQPDLSGAKLNWEIGKRVLGEECLLAAFDGELPDFIKGDDE